MSDEKYSVPVEHTATIPSNTGEISPVITMLGDIDSFEFDQEQMPYGSLGAVGPTGSTSSYITISTNTLGINGPGGPTGPQMFYGPAGSSGTVSTAGGNAVFHDPYEEIRHRLEKLEAMIFEEKQIRDNHPAVRTAYDEYQFLLMLAKRHK